MSRLEKLDNSDSMCLLFEKTRDKCAGCHWRDEEQFTCEIPRPVWGIFVGDISKCLD